MHLKKYTDYALRVLIYAAAKPESELVNKKEIAEAYGISENHIAKIVYELSKFGLIETIRGRGGGIQLADKPSQINVGDVVRKMEGDFALFECFDPKTNDCVLTPACKLRHVLHDALGAFLEVLDQYTLEDMVENREELRHLLGF
ncbi:BadM/Rrf2 family transcriptional regulator [Salsuginibacillus halophilus]|uniref:HTH-type transcriptional regulator NsrR n=1 Tax=Salsuginibacillus halophilus TaxID=517424 RepID=A0A2P8H924_9BACI|nr:Rrf2 family transcriptional regulator [Salsuginibacillus halophilus]PSL42733.1 BadM/Rrf2 family transcriptional regulator [Salsuginibacillus halophilus]